MGGTSALLWIGKIPAPADGVDSWFPTHPTVVLWDGWGTRRLDSSLRQDDKSPDSSLRSE